MAIPGLNFLQKTDLHDLIGIDLNEEFLKIVHVKVTSLRREVAHLISHDVRGMPDEDIAVFITKTLMDFKITNARAFINAPLHTAITRNIEIPSRDPEEIYEIVSLQASRHTPYSRSEIIIDTLTLGIIRENYTKVLLVIVPREPIVRQTKILEKANLSIERVFFSPEGICYACSKILGSESNDTTIAIVHMDTAFTSFIVVQRGQILFVRGISIGAEHLLEEKEIYSSRFADELQKSLESYLVDEAGPKPAELLLMGVVGEIMDLDDLFRGTLNIPIRHQTYFNHFAISKKALESASSSKRVSFFNVIAPLLLSDKMKIDLISEERKLKLRLEKRNREMMKAGVLLMILFAILLISMAGKLYFRNVYLNNLKTRYKPVKEDAKKLEQLFVETQVMRDYLANRGRSLETLMGLYEALPSDMRLTDIKYDDGEKFAVKGTSKTMASVFAFVSNLDKTNKLKNVKTKYVTTRNEDGMDVADFEVTADIEKEGAS